MKKIKIFLFIILLILIIILTYYRFYNNKQNLLVLGNNLTKEDIKYYDYVKLYLENNNLLKSYDNSYVKNNYLTKDLTKDIYNNNKVYINNKEHNIKTLLAKANIVLIGLNNNELKNDYESCNLLLKNIEELLNQVNIYKRDKVYVLGFYDDGYNKYVTYENNKLKQLTIDYKMTYIDINSIVNNSDSLDANNNLSLNLNNKVGSKIIKKLEKDLSK